MTRQLDLRTGRPVWSAYRAQTVPAASLDRDVETDVLVVGLGISGAMVADVLSAQGHRVLGVDRRRGPAQGSTAASTALVQFEIDVPLSHLRRQIGTERAMRAWRRSRLAVGNLRDRIAALGIRCDLEARSSLYLAGDVLDAQDLADEARIRRAAGLPAEWLDAETLGARFGISREAAILSPGNLALHPRKLTAGFLRAAAERGARFLAPVEVTRLTQSADDVTVETGGDPNAPTIRARHVVLATGYELVAPAEIAEHRIISTWAIATRPQPRAVWPEAALIWEASDPYLYLRATPDGRVICGGGDEDFTDEERRDALLPEKTALLSERLGNLFPNIDPTPDFAWTGSFGTTETGLPIIRALPHRPRVHAVLGYGGNGITYSRIAAELIATALDGGEDTDADLYAG